MILSFLVTLFIFSAKVLGEPNMKELAGTWSSKSNTVFTGPGFYDPVSELLIEPDLPGISYSFTEDGYYEEALYRVSSNPQNHSCPTATMIYQHGKYELKSDGALSLKPIAVDGRQLLSDPCGEASDKSVYSRYVQETTFKKYQVSVDSYNGRYMLQIYKFDGSEMQPLYLAYRPPLMLPTKALNPTDSASETKTSLRKRIKRSLENQYRTNAKLETSSAKYEFWWWTAIAGIGLGSAVIFLH